VGFVAAGGPSGRLPCQFYVGVSRFFTQSVGQYRRQTGDLCLGSYVRNTTFVCHLVYLQLDCRAKSGGFCTLYRFCGIVLVGDQDFSVYPPFGRVLTGPANSPCGERSLSNDEILRRIAAEGEHTVVVVSHDPRWASFSDRTVQLEDGRVVEDTRNS
jgi:hypothetical protein